MAAKTLTAEVSQSLCDELADICPTVAAPREVSNAAPKGGSWLDHLNAIWDAIKAKNAWAIYDAIDALIRHIRGQDSGVMGARAVVGLDWNKVSAFIIKLLSIVGPIIFG